MSCHTAQQHRYFVHASESRTEANERAGGSTGESNHQWMILKIIIIILYHYIIIIMDDCYFIIKWMILKMIL